MTDWSQECLCETPQNFDCKRQFKEETCELSAFSFFYVICMLKRKQMQKKKEKTIIIFASEAGKRSDLSHAGPALVQLSLQAVVLL